MSNVKISALTAGAALDGSELVPVVQDSDTVRTTAQAIANTADSLSGPLAFPGATGNGIKIDSETTPIYGWRDITGFVLPDQQGANSPTLAAFIGGSVRRFAFSATDKCDAEFHIPHDYVPGSDLFIHYHWSHNGTTISGNIVATFAVTYAKGHGQAVFVAEKTVVASKDTVSATATPRYSHEIEEVQLSTTGGAANLLDSDDIEADGVIGVNFTMTTIPTIGGGSPNEPFVFMIDLHYQSTNLGTHDKVPGFYYEP